MSINTDMLQRWLAFGKAMQKAGSELPRHLIADTEQAITTAEQAQHPWGQLLDMARQVIRDGHVHDVGGGDLAVTTCEAFEGLDAFLRQHFPEPLGELTVQEQRWLEADIKKKQAQQVEPVARDVLMAFGVDVLVESGSSMREADLAAIADRYAAQPPAVAVPDGYALAPIEPTPEMVDAGAEGDGQFYEHAGFVYRAMLAAAPQATAEDSSVVQAGVAVPDATVGKLRLLVAACNRIEEEAEELEGPDGLQMGIAIDYWHELTEALTTARKALAAAQKVDS